MVPPSTSVHHCIEVLLRIEQARHPLIDRTTLPGLLEQIVHELQAVLSVPWVTIHVRDELFDPPLPLTITVGTPASEAITYDLSWAGIFLGQVHLAASIQPSDPNVMLPLLLRVLGESIAEVHAAEQLVQHTRDQVRHDLALDLHDAARNRLAGIILLAEGATRDLEYHHDAVRTQLRAIHEAARQAQEQVRFLIGQLRGQPITGDLRAEIDALLAFIAQVAPDLVITTNVALPTIAGDTAACLIGILRNALTNVVQHAQARAVQVMLVPADAGVLLRVCDDGIGCDPDHALAAPGVGFDSLFAWVRRHSGRIAIQSTPGNGLCLEVWLPAAPLPETT